MLTLYDIEMPVPEARAAIQKHFRRNSYVRDNRVVSMLIDKGYMEFEETLLQYKQRTHLLKVLEGYIAPDGSSRKYLGRNSTPEEQFKRS